MEETKIDKLRKELIELREERAKVILEKGLAAEYNKDLRENAAYDYWYEKETEMTVRILQVMEIIREEADKTKPKRTIKHKKVERIRGSYESHKWL